MKQIFDVSKGNNKALFLASIPCIILAWMFWGVFYVLALLACLIGRRRALDVLYKTKELM